MRDGLVRLLADKFCIMKLSWSRFYLFGFLIISLQFSCNLTGDVSIKEVKRVQSPDHRVEAIIIEADAGATTSTSSKVFIVKPGKKITADDFTSAVFNCDNFSGIDITWKENRSLIVSYKAARILNSSNIWKSSEVDTKTYIAKSHSVKIRYHIQHC
jgi:hypothetical protein